MASSHENSLQTIAQELSGRLVFDDPRVFDRLQLTRVSDDLVAKCCIGLQNDRRVADAKERLLGLARASSELEEDESEEELIDDPEIGLFYDHSFKKESKMYQPLTTLFQYIEHFDSAPESTSSVQPEISFQQTDKLEIKSCGSPGTTYRMPVFNPDFFLVDSPRPVPDEEQSDKCSVTWLELAAFCVVKLSEAQGPKSTAVPTPNSKESVKHIVIQAADCARVHLSTRPFQVFSVALLIFGTQFCVAMFDREGAVFSPVHDMWTDSHVFVRVVRALTHFSSPYDLGRDPTAHVLPLYDHDLWIEYVKNSIGVLIGTSEWYPTFKIKGFPGFENRTLITIGEPIWVSVSLLGRGTSVWLVADERTKEVFVFKNTWRKNDRMPESEVYETIDDEHPALAQYESGGDVVLYKSGGRCPLTVQNLRMSPSTDVQHQLSAQDTVLHRLIFKSYGRSVTEWTSYRELLEAIRAAVSAHEFLCSKGILHRDINAGNVMIYASLPGQGPPPAAGFLIDLEPALTESGIMTGTAHFLATEVLDAIESEELKIERQAHHDLESFVYVLAYGLFGGLFLKGRKPDIASAIPAHAWERAQWYFNESFGRMSFREVFRNQRGLIVLEPGLQLRNHLPSALNMLLLDLRRKIQLQADWFPTEFLTHTYLLHRLDEAIATL